MNSSPLWAVVTALLASVFTLVIQGMLEKYRDDRKAEQVSHAIAAEVSALLRVIELRKYRKGLAHLYERALCGDGQVLKVWVQEQYCPVIRANLQVVGLLPAELPLRTTAFLTLVSSLMEDVHMLDDRGEQFDAPRLAALYSEMLVLLEEMGAVGEQIIGLVATMYGSPHSRYPTRVRIQMLGRSLTHWRTD